MLTRRSPISSVNNIIEIKNIFKKFGKYQALKDVSLDIERGQSYALLGPNGSGKTTLLKTLMGSIHATSGKVKLNGNTDIQSEDYKRSITYMPQYPGFLPHLSAKESVELLIQLRQQEAINAEKLVADLGIDKFWTKAFSELSGGMKQKINILQCFMFDFEVAFLDEPTASLDPQISGYLKNLVNSLKEDGKTILFTSHIMSEVEEMADQMALIDNGKILLVQSPEKFVEDIGSRNLEQAMLEYWSTNGH